MPAVERKPTNKSLKEKMWNHKKWRHPRTIFNTPGRVWWRRQYCEDKTVNAIAPERP